MQNELTYLHENKHDDKNWCWLLALYRSPKDRNQGLSRRLSGEGNCDVPASIPPNDAGTSYNYLLVATDVVREGGRQVRAHVKPCHRRGGGGWFVGSATA